ncbi:hypothetical protein SAMN04488065_2116 [Haloplanus vescus]|uniref:Uncharacterized protein n=1 Tax=Haloplanus vescus TaxID=555874 RepID=A0A1H3Z2Z8_9EURY|nr:hypothetical protein [Haloplanus vescus]SEA18037.1 hypothetical protein SAMN04488065_2116 [Haloplanus vescus]
MTDPDRRIVRFDLTIAASNVGVAGMLSTVAVATAWWWLTPLAALGSALLFAASDRSRNGLWALFGVGILGMAAIVWAVIATDSGARYLPPALLGVGVGYAVNRLLFGVVWSVPAVRRQRETS